MRRLTKRLNLAPLMAAATLFTGLGAAAGAPALAQFEKSYTPQHKPYRFTPQPFGYAVAAKVKEMLHGLTESRCIGEAASRDATFVGIPRGNYHLSEPVRSSLNNMAQEHLNKSFAPFLRFNSSQNLSFIAPLNTIDPTGQKELQKSVDQILKHTAYLLVFKTLRPQKNVVQLQLNLFARPQDGVVRCTKSALLYVHLPSFKTFNPYKLDSTESRDFVQSKYMYPYVFERFMRDITSYKRLRLVNQFRMEGGCDLRRRAPSQFRSNYFRFRDQKAGQFNTMPDDWPGLRLHKSKKGENLESYQAEKDEGIMLLRYELSSIDRDVIDLTVEMMRDGDIINTAQMSVFVNPQTLAGCFNREADPLLRFFNGVGQRGLKFDIKSAKRKFIVNQDPIDFKINVDEPLYLVCMSVGRDGTAKIVYPWKSEQLQKPWKAKTRLTYPNGFGFRDIVLQRTTKELFGCYGSRHPLPDALQEAIIKAHVFNRGGSGVNDELTPGEFEKLASELERLPGTGSAFTWLRAVRE